MKTVLSNKEENDPKLTQKAACKLEHKSIFTLLKNANLGVYKHNQPKNSFKELKSVVFLICT